MKVDERSGEPIERAPMVRVGRFPSERKRGNENAQLDADQHVQRSHSKDAQPEDSGEANRKIERLMEEGMRQSAGWGITQRKQETFEKEILCGTW